MICSLCLRDLPDTEFYATGAGGLVSKCKRCTIQSNIVSGIMRQCSSPDDLQMTLSKKQAQAIYNVIGYILCGGKVPRFANLMTAKDLQDWFSFAGQVLKQYDAPPGLFAQGADNVSLIHPEVTTTTLSEIAGMGDISDDTRQLLRDYHIGRSALEDTIRTLRIPAKFYKYRTKLVKAFEKYVCTQRLMGYSNNAWHKMLQCVDDMCYSYIQSGYVDPQALSEFLQVPEAFRQPVPLPFLDIYDNGLRTALTVSEATIPSKYRTALMAFTESVAPPKIVRDDDKGCSIYLINWYMVPCGYVGYLQTLDPPVTPQYWDDPIHRVTWSGVAMAG